MAVKKRLDLLLEEIGLCSSRQTARTAIMDGAVLVNGVKETKPGTLVREDALVELTGAWRQTKKFVSRGGLKLEKALLEFGVEVVGRHCLDVGASTGGFTDCLLQHGAALVYAVDVGYGQLDWRLRTDDRVLVRERLNARNLCRHELYEHGAPLATLAVMDLSFISILKVLPAVLPCLTTEAEIIALIKPQFEAGVDLVGKGGVVRSAKTHAAVIASVINAGAALDLVVVNLSYSPLKGPAGNIEFLCRWRKGAGAHGQNLVVAEAIENVVAEAHSNLS